MTEAHRTTVRCHVSRNTLACVGDGHIRELSETLPLGGLPEEFVSRPS